MLDSTGGTSRLAGRRFLLLPGRGFRLAALAAGDGELHQVGLVGIHFGGLVRRGGGLREETHFSGNCGLSRQFFLVWTQEAALAASGTGVSPQGSDLRRFEEDASSTGR